MLSFNDFNITFNNCYINLEKHERGYDTQTYINHQN